MFSVKISGLGPSAPVSSIDALRIDAASPAQYGKLGAQVSSIVRAVNHGGSQRWVVAVVVGKHEVYPFSFEHSEDAAKYSRRGIFHLAPSAITIEA